MYYYCEKSMTRNAFAIYTKSNYRISLILHIPLAMLYRKDTQYGMLL